MHRNKFIAFAVLCVAAGTVLLLENFGLARGAHKLWPVFPAVIGAGLLLVFRNRRKGDLVLLGVAVYVLCFSALALYCNFAGWGALSALWPLFIGFTGVSFLVATLFSGKRGIFLLISLLLIAACATFFLVFGVTPRLWPVSLILLGLSIILVRIYG